MSENMNERMQKSMEELRAKHAAGTNEIDDSDRAPTGAAYREVNRIHAERAKAHRAIGPKNRTRAKALQINQCKALQIN